MSSDKILNRTFFSLSASLIAVAASLNSAASAQETASSAGSDDDVIVVRGFKKCLAPILCAISI